MLGLGLRDVRDNDDLWNRDHWCWQAGRYLQAGPQSTLVGDGALPLLAQHTKVVVASTAVATPGRVIRVDLKDKVRSSRTRFKLHGDEGGEGGEVGREVHFIMKCAVKAFEEWVAAWGRSCDHAAMAGQDVGDEAMVKSSRHSNHHD